MWEVAKLQCNTISNSWLSLGSATSLYILKPPMEDTPIWDPKINPKVELICYIKPLGTKKTQSNHKIRTPMQDNKFNLIAKGTTEPSSFLSQETPNSPTNPNHSANKQCTNWTRTFKLPCTSIWYVGWRENQKEGKYKNIEKDSKMEGDRYLGD